MRPSSSLVLRRSLAFVSAAVLFLSAPLLAAQSTADAKGTKELKPVGALPGSMIKAIPPSSEDFPQQPSVPSSIKVAGSVEAADTPTGTAAGAMATNAVKAQKEKDATHEGLTLHGHWTIDVKNPDGTLAQHRTFENSITNYGQELLIGLMSGYVVPSDYGIYISPQGGGTSPCGGYGCVIVRSLTTLPGSALCPVNSCTTNLTYGVALSDAGNVNGGTFTLSGSVTASQAGSINNVQTYYGSCPIVPANATALTTVSPATCSTSPGSGGARSLSAASITSVAVTASQIIQVTVTFTFS